jgi:hypothetical protein
MNQKIILIRQILASFVVIVAITGIYSCEKYSYTLPKISTVDTLHFSTDIQPIFSANCTSCHGAAKAPDLRVDKSFAALTKGGYITPPAETSTLYTIMISASHEARSSATDKQKVLIWIQQGALNNK